MILGGPAASSSQCWWTAAIANCPSRRILSAKTSPLPRRRTCSSGSPKAGGRMRWCSNENELDAQTPARYRVADGGRDSDGAGYGAGLQGGGRTGDQEGPGVARQNGGEPVCGAFDPHAD